MDRMLGSGLGSSLEIEVIDTLEGLAAFAPQWEQFYSQVPQASPYFCFDWLIAAFQAARRPFAPRVCVVRDARGMLAILPFVRRREGPLRSSILRLASGSWAPRLTAIVDERAREQPLLETVLARLRKLDRRWLYGHVRGIPESSPLLPADGRREGPFRVQRRVFAADIIIELPESWDVYCRTLSPHFQKNLSYETRVLNRDHRLRVTRLGLEPLGDASELDRLVADALDVSRKSWQGSASWGTAISDGNVEPFFRSICRKMAARGSLDLSVLYADDRPISFIWGAARWPMTSIAKLGYDQELKKKSPGNVHVAMHIQDSIARGGREIDFGHEFPEYKLKWSQRSDPLHELWYYPRTPASSLVRWWRQRSLQCEAA